MLRIMGWTPPRMVQRYAKLIQDDLKELHTQSWLLAVGAERTGVRKIRPSNQA